MTRWHIFQGAVWAATMAGMVQWHWTTYGEPINPVVAFITGGLAAYYGTGILLWIFHPFRKLFGSSDSGGLKPHLPSEEPPEDHLISELLSGLDASGRAEATGADSGGRLVEGTLSEPRGERLSRRPSRR